jgi:hypothetical protein
MARWRARQSAHGPAWRRAACDGSAGRRVAVAGQRAVVARGGGRRRLAVEGGCGGGRRQLARWSSSERRRRESTSRGATRKLFGPFRRHRHFWWPTQKIPPKLRGAFLAAQQNRRNLGCIFSGPTKPPKLRGYFWRPNKTVET